MLELLAKPVVERLNRDTAARATTFREAQGRLPRLAVVLVGKNPASIIYTRKKGEAAVALGMDHETIVLSDEASTQEVHAVSQRLNHDPTVDGILIQRPLPASFREDEVVFWVDQSKDVDGLHPENAGRLLLGLPSLQPCTPAGVMKMLEHYKISIAGKRCCVLGRSSIVGKPMASLLLQADATVLQAHSKTKDLRDITRQADLLVVAIGKPRFIDSSYVREGATVIDVGISRDAHGKVAGDVNFAEVSKVAGAITPVPGGVGPMTIAMLMQNTIRAAELRVRK